jgi:hypothetical protein
MVSGKEHFSWGRDDVSHNESTHGLVYEVLDTQTACEKALSTFLSNASGRRTAMGNDSSCLSSPFLNYTIYCVII